MNASSHRGGAEDYERLRSHVLGGPVPEGPLLRTLDVLLHSGLALWMIFGWPEVNDPVVLHPSCSLVPQHELVFLLANMIEALLLT
jgi:hypothetical protein